MQRLMLFSMVNLVLPQLTIADNWPDWRGPDRNGVVPAGDYPTEWGEDRNIVWKIPLPGWGTSTPAIWEDHIFVTCAHEDRNLLIGLNREGKELWRETYGETVQAKNRKASSANPSPVTDGEHIYAYYRNGDLACVDFAGKTVWQTNLQEAFGRDRLNWDLGTSPVLTNDLVVVAVMHQGPSYVVAYDKVTGEQKWKTDRDLGAPAEARDSYSTPIVQDDNGRQMLIVLGGDFLTAYDAASGEETWRVGDFNPQQRRNLRSIASPTILGDLIVAPYSRGETLTAVRLGGKGDVTESHVAWEIEGSSADVPTPVAFEGRAYICGDRGDVSCIDLTTGERRWTETLPRARYPYSSSPVIANGNLYATREDGTTFVLKLGAKPELIAENKLRENTYATPAFADGKIYLRTSDWLFCIGEK